MFQYDCSVSKVEISTLLFICIFYKLRCWRDGCLVFSLEGDSSVSKTVSVSQLCSPFLIALELSEVERH